jgi:hypothetical protein
MTWVLVVLLLNGSQGGAALTAVRGFKTRASCDAAGASISKVNNSIYTDVKWICAEVEK